MASNAICCPQCGAVESINSVTCHRCGRELQKIIDVAPVYIQFFQRDDAVTKILQWTYGIVFVIAAILTVLAGGTPFEALAPGATFNQTLYEMGALNGVAVLRDGQWFRLLTATFLHAGIVHLMFNLMALNAVGQETERNLGHMKFFILYFCTGVLANMFSLFWHGARYSQVGASGAICGLIGAIYIIGKIRGGVYGNLLKHVASRWIVMTVIFGLLLRNMGIDNAAHISGMVVGAGMTKLLGLQRR